MEIQHIGHGLQANHLEYLHTMDIEFIQLEEKNIFIVELILLVLHQEMSMLYKVELLNQLKLDGIVEQVLMLK